MISERSRPEYLSNPVYAALTTAEAEFALVHARARRFLPEVIPFAAVEEPGALGDLVELLAVGEEIYLTTEAGEGLQRATGLEVVSTLAGVQMKFRAAVPGGADDGDVVALGPGDVGEMMELKARAFPGFFGPRAVELGSFFGIREPESGRLVAMGGERLATFAEREVSAVCTDPEHVGRGYAARIVRAVLRQQERMGVGSMLHATAKNGRAISLYERLGFVHSGMIDFVKVRRV